MTCEFFLGGTRSGKSRLAEQAAQTIADRDGKQLVYIATATAGDEEMAARIKKHQQGRGDYWQLVEEPLALAATLEKYSTQDACIVVDCLTLWLTNLLLAEENNRFETEVEKLFAVLPQLRGHIIFISNEVGQGLVATDPLSRRFVDETGLIHQRLAQVCDRVYFVTAGLAQQLK